MRIVNSVRETGTENPALTGFVWTPEEDPTWLRFRADLRGGVMTGIHMSACRGTVPRATPFQFRFPNGEQARQSAVSAAMLLLGDISKERVAVEGTSRRGGPDAFEQLAAWEDFLNGGTGSGTDAAADKGWEIPKDDWNPGGLRGVRNTNDGGLMLGRGRHLIVGKPMSGFDALKALRDPNLPFAPGNPGEIDIQAARDALKSVSRPSSIAVAWYGQAGEETRTYRMQAAQAMPILAGLVAESHDLSKAVDEMRPIQPILTERTGLPKAGVKRLGKLTASIPAAPIFEVGEAVQGEDALGVNRRRRFSISGSVSIDKAMRYLAELPPDRTPNDDAGWKAYHDILTGCAIPLSNAFDLSVTDILAASKGNWTEYRDTLARAADFEPERFDRRTMALTSIDAIEAVEAFTRTAVLPQALTSIRETEQELPPVTGEHINAAFDVSKALVTGKAKNVAAHLFEVARRYASRIPAMMEIEGRGGPIPENAERFQHYGDDAFPVLVETYTADNGLIVRPLRNAQELAEEGERMSHCVGCYVSRARQAQCHLFSVRSADDAESHATLELAGVSGESATMAAANISVVQNRAVRNGAPSDAASEASKEFVRKVREGEIEIRFQEIEEWREHMRESGELRTRRNVRPNTSWDSVLESDWQNERVRDALWDEWGTVMGGKIAKADNPGVIYSEKGARDLVAAMNPRAAAILMERANAPREAPAEDAPAP